MNEDKKVTKVTPDKEPGLLAVLNTAVQEGAPIETIERLVALKERLDKAAAERAFNEDMASFQAECPAIPKLTEGGKTRDGQVAFMYASLEDIESYIKEPLSKYGFSYRWDSEKRENGTRTTTCFITHRMGYERSAKFESSIDQGTSLMNALQKEGSTIGYGKRNSLVLALGLVAVGEDDDGAGATEQQLTDEQVAELNKGIDAGGEVLSKKILKAYNLADVRFLPSEKFNEAMERINAYVDRKGANDADN